MGSLGSKQVAARFSQTRYSSIKFPLKFDIFFNGRTRIQFAIGNKNDPTHLLSLLEGWYGELVLYNGPTTEAEPVVLVRNGRRMGMIDDIEVAASADGKQAIQETWSRYNGWSEAFDFAAPVGQDMVPEKFEWRKSRGDEVRMLGERSSGWKLLRLEQQEEIVAVAVEAKLGRSLTKVGTFEFVGSGARGEMGDAWAAMAVASFVRIYQRQMQGAMNTPATPTGAVAVTC